MSYDVATMREGLAAPGMDPRQWISFGTIQADSANGHAVSFQDSSGNAHPNGVIVQVKLEPSGIIVSCMVGSQVSGEGEFEYHVMGPGDTVLVAIPQGDERAGCTIICRISHGQDNIPPTVAGMDVTQNNISYKRLLTPFVLETGGSYLIRHALTGASWSIDPTGNIIFTDSEGNNLSMTQSVLIFQEVTGTALLQIDPAALTVAMQSGATALILDDTKAKMAAEATLQTGGTFMIATGSADGQTNALGHACTIEQVCAILANIIVPSPGPLHPALVAAIPLAVSTGLPADVAAAITTALGAATPDPTGMKPGVGRSTLLF